MKNILFAPLLLLAATASTAAAAKSLTVTVRGVRSSRGNILVMAAAEGQETPAYGMAAARTDSAVVVTLTGIDAAAADVSLFHDEDGDFKMKSGDRGPLEGYAAKRCKLPEAQNAATLTLYYPDTENR